jgi:signal transduction histidine kinase
MAQIRGKLLRPWGQLVLLFLGLLFAIYAATQNESAPLLVLFMALYVLTSNFSVPLERTQVGLVPLVSTSSVLLVGWEGAGLALGLGLLLAELTRPLWQPLWQNSGVAQPSWRVRGGVWGVYTAVFLLSTAVYEWQGGLLPLPALIYLPNNNELYSQQLPDMLWLTASYFLFYLLGHALLTRAQGLPLRSFATVNLPILAAFGLLTQTFALFGVFTYTAVGLPAYVIFSVGVALFTISSWVSWQNRVIMRQQVEQFAYLNRIGSSLRETLDLPEVLQRTYEQVTQLIPADSFFIALQNPEQSDEWHCPISYEQGQRQPSPPHYTPDDFTRWVATHNRWLDLDPENMHHAQRYNLTPPQPRPDAWLGVPLSLSNQPNQVLGVMVIQRLPPNKPFTYWSRELLLAIGQQASTAIHNARLYAETVRLFNLTDEALARRVEQITAVLNSTHEGILMLDRAGEIVLLNPIVTHLLQLPSGAKINPQLVYQQLGYTQQELDHLLQALAQGQTPASHQTIYQLPQPAPRPIHLERTERPVVAQSGAIMGWLIVLRDVTQAQEQADWRKQFTHMVVHDLRNPVTSLLSTLRLLEGQLPHASLADLAALAQTAQYGCHHLLDMVDSLMDINRLEAGQLLVEAEAMHLGPLAERVVAHMQPLAQEKGVALTAVFTPNLPPIWGDEELLRRVLVNLLDNALKFTPQHGRVTLTLHPAPAPLPHHDLGIQASISDTGPGIPPTERDRIFERFVRIGRGGAQVRGTGIGLSFCRLALEAQNGRIWVEDTPADSPGSTFVFTLPGIPHFELDEE